jgi:hypothetical protein
MTHGGGKSRHIALVLRDVLNAGRVVPEVYSKHSGKCPAQFESPRADSEKVEDGAFNPITL